MARQKEENIGKEIGKKFKSCREKAGLTQSEVASKAGVHVNYYARIERGEENPSLEKVQGIMKVLKIKSLDIL